MKEVVFFFVFNGHCCGWRFEIDIIKSQCIKMFSVNDLSFKRKVKWITVTTRYTTQRIKEEIKHLSFSATKKNPSFKSIITHVLPFITALVQN